MTDLPVTVYTPESPLRQPARFVREMIADLLASRELARRLFIRDLSAQYRNSVLGYVWVFVPPLVASLPFIYLNSAGVLRMGDTPIPYAAYATVGTIIWQTFVDALNSPLRTVNAARSMLTRINFPREAILLSGLMQVGFSFLVRLAAAGGGVCRIRFDAGGDGAAVPPRHAERRADRIHDRPDPDADRPPLWRRAAQPADCQHVPDAADAGALSGAGFRLGRHGRRPQSADAARHDDARLADDWSPRPMSAASSW